MLSSIDGGTELSLEISPELAAVEGAVCMRCPKLSKGQMGFLPHCSSSVCVWSGRFHLVITAVCCNKLMTTGPRFICKNKK